jgi:hypothetical protein
VGSARGSVADPVYFDTDPAQAFHFDTDTDPDTNFHFDTDPDPYCFKDVIYLKTVLFINPNLIFLVSGSA